MDWFPQSGRLGCAIIRRLDHGEMLRWTQRIEAVDERIARCAVLYIHALAELAEMPQGLPLVTGSAT